MADMPTIVETGKNNDNGWGGNAWGAGVGGFIGSMFGNGGFGGWGGYGGRGAQIGADVAIANQLEHVSDQVQQVAISGLQSANGTQMQIANTGAGVTAGVTQNTIANLQGFAGVGQQICCLGKSLAQDIDANGDRVTDALHQNGIQGMQNAQLMADRLCGVNSNISAQGYEGRLQNQALAAQLQNQHADLKAVIIEQGCQDRETMRDIQAQAIRDKLAEANAKIANLETRQALTDSNQNQTLYMMAQIQNLFQQYKTTPTTAAGA